MATTIGGFAVNISSFTGGLTKGLNLAGKQVESFTSRIAGVGKRIATLGIASGLAGVGGVSVLFARTGAGIDELAKLSDRLGIAIPELQSLQHAASLSGVEDMGAVLEKMQKGLGDAAKGTGEGAKLLEDWGVNAADIIRMKPGDQFGLIADKINGLGTASEKAAASARDPVFLSLYSAEWAWQLSSTTQSPCLSAIRFISSISAGWP